MKIPVKFVPPLDEKQEKELNGLIKDSKKVQVRRRAQAILLSAKGYGIDEIAKICDIGRNAVSSWIDKWDKEGIKGLEDKPRSGHPCTLTDKEKQLVIKLAKKNPRSTAKIIAKLQKKTGKLVSETTIKRILKAAKWTWKRVKKSLKSEPVKEEFEQASQAIKELRQQHDNDEIELWYFDETGFDLQPTVPYAWQPQGQTIEVPSQSSKRLNVLGFVTPDNNFESFCCQGSVDSDVVISVFDAFANIKSCVNRVVLIDNASIHTSGKFVDRIGNWEEKGVIIYFIPAYCPKLNIIEIVWRFIKYHWLPFSAYLSFDDLVTEVENILAKIGSEFKIEFAS